MSDEELARLAKGWIAYWRDPKNEDTWEEFNRSDDYLELIENQSLEIWRMILVIHALDQSSKIQQILSAGLVENLLSMHGSEMIEMIEAQARKDPSFAKLLGGVWQNKMTDEIWARVQAVWDRRGWDGIPEN